jgi:hypothetical protein
VLPILRWGKERGWYRNSNGDSHEKNFPLPSEDFFFGSDRYAALPDGLCGFSPPPKIQAVTLYGAVRVSVSASPEKSLPMKPVKLENVQTLYPKRPKQDEFPKRIGLLASEKKRKV